MKKIGEQKTGTTYIDQAAIATLAKKKALEDILSNNNNLMDQQIIKSFLDRNEDMSDEEIQKKLELRKKLLNYE